MNIELTDNPNIVLIDGVERKCNIRSKSFPYLCVSIKRKSYSIHRLIAEQYIPNPENKPFVNHINGIKTDNRIENLEWVTPSENNIHASKILNKNKSRTARRCLTMEQAEEIRRIYKTTKISQGKLANLYSVKYGVIQKILKNKTYFA